MKQNKSRPLFPPELDMFFSKTDPVSAMPGRKKCKIGPRKRRRAQSVTLHESRLCKSSHTAHVAIAHCITALDVQTRPIPDTPPNIMRRKRPTRPLSAFKHPRKKARRIAVDLAQACEKVFEDHCIPSDDADLPLVQSAVLKFKNGTSMLASLILPA